MTGWITVTVAVLGLIVGIWIGIGAPGWPHKKPSGGSRRRLEKRPINPIAWGREGSRARRSHDRRRR